MRHIRWIMAGVVLLLLAGLVWPTPWRYASSAQWDTPVRFNRISGTAEALCSDGWHPLVRDEYDVAIDATAGYNAPVAAIHPCAVRNVRESAAAEASNPFSGRGAALDSVVNAVNERSPR